MGRLALLLPFLAGWMRVPYEDVDVVTRADLVVIAHLKPGSIQLVEHTQTDGRGASWEHHATLVITEALKGKVTATEVPLVIEYGLDPVLEGKLANAHETINMPGTWPKGSVQILDTGNSAMSFTPLVADATTDNVWLLRKHGASYRISDPEDLRPLNDRGYLSLYLAADPEPGVEQYVAKHADVRARRYLQHKDIERIAQTIDPGERVEKLLPYLERGVTWGLHDEAMEALLAVDVDASGPRLLALFPTADRRTRTTIISIWGKTKYKGAVEPLVKILQASDKFWAAQKLKGDWWNTDVESPVTRERRDRYADVYEAVNALAEIGDPAAKPALQLTLKRWKAIKFDNPQIVEACTAALAK